MSKKIKIVEIVKYNGHSQSSRGLIKVSFIAAYSELVKTVEALQLLSETVTLAVKLAGKKPFRLGQFMVNNVLVDGDGESKISFNGNCDNVELDNISELPLRNDDVPEFKLMMTAEIEEGEADE